MNRAAWDRHAAAFEATVCDITSTDKKRQLDDLVRLARLPRTGAVLVDLGCGVGSFIRRFGDRFEAIVGVDFAPRILARARQRLPSTIRFLAIEIARSARTLGTIADLTACLNVITSPSAARRAAVWRNLVAVTKPGGSTVEIDLEPRGEGTRLRLVHRGLVASERPSHAAGWDFFLPRLTAVAEGRELPASTPS